MLINIDVKGLEIVCAAELSKDKILCREILDGVDIHEVNRETFNLPTRLVSKVFKFRMIFGGGAYSYAHDIAFMHVSKSEKFWQDVIDEYYKKYNGIETWHQSQIEKAKSTQRLEIPSGRYFPFSPEPSFSGFKWPITKIKNYPVQGFGADLVKLARLEANRLLNEAAIEAILVSTVHDSLVADAPSKNLDPVAKILLQSVESVPALCKKVWNYDFSLPLTAEVQYGPNKRDMQDYKF